MTTRQACNLTTVATELLQRETGGKGRRYFGAHMSWLDPRFGDLWIYPGATLLVCHRPSVEWQDFELAREPSRHGSVRGRIVIVAHDWARVTCAAATDPDESPMEIRCVHDSTCSAPPVHAVDPDLVAVRRSVGAGLLAAGCIVAASLAARRWWGWPAWILTLPLGYAGLVIAASARALWAYLRARR